MTKRIDWTFIFRNGFSLCLFFYLFSIGGQGELIAKSFHVYLSNLIIFTFLLVLFFVFNIKRGKILSEFNYIVPILLLLGCTFVSVIFSGKFWISLNEYYLWGLYFFTLIGVINLQIAGWNKLQLTNSFLVVGGVFVFSQLYQSLIWIMQWKINNIAINPSLWAYRTKSPNLTAGFVNLVLMIAIGQVLYLKNQKKKYPYFILIIGSIYVLFLTSSRGGLGGLLGGLGIMTLVYLINAPPEINNIWKKYKRHLIAIGLLIMIAGIGFIGAVFDPFRGGILIRFDLWKLAITLFRERPFFGNGLYTFGSQVARLYSIPPNIVHSHGHNVFLNILAEQGVIGLFVFSGVIFVVFKKLLANYKSTKNYLYLGYLGALGTFLVHGLVDTLYVEPSYSFSIAIILGLCLPVSAENYSKNVPLCRSSTTWSLVFFLGLGWFLFFQKVPLDNAIRISASSRENAIGYFSEALERNPKSALIHQQQAINYSFISQNNNNNEYEYERLAIESYQKAINNDPLWAMNYANLGMLLAQNGDLPKAYNNLQIAEKLAPDSALIILNKAIVAEEMGFNLEAESSYWRYLFLVDTWDLGPFWHETPLRVEIFTETQKTGWDNKYKSQTLNELMKIMVADPYRTFIHLELADHYLQNMDYIKAKEEIKITELIITNYQSLTGMEVYWRKAQLEIIDGNYEIGIKYAEEAFDGWRFQSANGPGTYGSSEYGTRIFRKPFMIDDLIPQFVKTPITASWIERLNILGEWYVEMDRLDDAAKTFEEVLLFDGNYIQAINNLQLLQLKN